MIEINNCRYYSIQEVAKIFKVSSSSINNWRNEGKLEGVKISKRRILYSEKSIEKLLKGDKQ